MKSKNIFIFCCISLILFNWAKCDQIDELKKQFENELNLMKSEFSNQMALMKNELDEVKNQINSSQSTCDSDWISFFDTKCFKVLEEKGNELEAKGNCSLLESNLITIQSLKEQNFLSNILKSYKKISDNVWIGLEYVNKTFKWMDGNDLKFENWGENAVKDGNNKCVQMSLAESDLGKWTDENCQRKYLIVCQKKQSTKTVLSEEIKNITKFIEKQQKVIDSQQIESGHQKKSLENQQVQLNSLIPLGFLYTQLPNQSSPQDLWPQMQWSEETNKYAGLFFRAQGGASESFGSIQQANQSWISNSYCDGYFVDRQGSPNSFQNFSKGTWTDLWRYSSNSKLDACGYLQLFTTEGEVRPRNTAIKIWKRIK